MNYDITFCIYAGCPFEDCERHMKRITTNTSGPVSISDFRGTCRRYIGLLVDELSEEETK